MMPMEPAKAVRSVLAFLLKRLLKDSPRAVLSLRATFEILKLSSLSSAS